MAASWLVAISNGIVTVRHDMRKDREMIPGQTLLVVTFVLTAALILVDVFAAD